MGAEKEKSRMTKVFGVGTWKNGVDIKIGVENTVEGVDLESDDQQLGFKHVNLIAH